MTHEFDQKFIGFATLADQVKFLYSLLINIPELVIFQEISMFSIKITGINIHWNSSYIMKYYGATNYQLIVYICRSSPLFLQNLC